MSTYPADSHQGDGMVAQATPNGRRLYLLSPELSQWPDAQYLQAGLIQLYLVVHADDSSRLMAIDISMRFLHLIPFT